MIFLNIQENIEICIRDREIIKANYILIFIVGNKLLDEKSVQDCVKCGLNKIIEGSITY